uniref:Putative secreted protein n=1 Tax=Anopheles marajoara TaxID=58244 RepID=A0A2M4CC74_9DIPT
MDLAAWTTLARALPLASLLSISSGQQHQQQQQQHHQRTIVICIPLPILQHLVSESRRHWKLERAEEEEQRSRKRKKR